MDVLAMALERIAGEPLDAFLQRRVFQPLGMTSTGYRPDPALRWRIAPTEVTPPRGYPLRGEVHDENAYALGGVAGHAGLFSTANDLSRFAQMMLNGGEFGGVRIFEEATVQRFTTRTAGTRALGWETCDHQHGCGEYLGTAAYGHIGYTGTSLWIDPERQMFVILLTNRVHAARARRPATVIADIRNDLADAAAWAVVDEPDFAVRQVAFRADNPTNWNKPLRSRSARARATARKGSRSVTELSSATKTTAKGKTAARKATKPKAKTSAKPAANGGGKPTAKKFAKRTPTAKPARTTAAKSTRSARKTRAA
jgi:CubicO group peptidase (beta-lactamase class C family)